MPPSLSKVTTFALRGCRHSLFSAAKCTNISRQFGTIIDKIDNIVKRGRASECEIPRQSDVVIIGGGLVGSAAAFWLKQKTGPGEISVTVLERDLQYTRASSTLSVGGIRQQFSSEENILMSLFSADFFENIKEHLCVYDSDQDPPDLQFNQNGYLILAADQKAAVSLEEANKTQISCGAKVKLMAPSLMKEKFPWLKTDDLFLGSFGLENEGWFDPWLLLDALRKRNRSLGVAYVQAEVVGFDTSPGSVDHVMVKNMYGEVKEIQFVHCVNAAGPWAGEVNKMLGGSFPLPVEPRKRYVYVFHCPNGPGVDCPLLVDPKGVYFRREGLGGNYICGGSPTEEEEPDIATLEVDYSFFNQKLWPILANRVPAFENIKVKNAWAGYYDYNYVDQNLIIGKHPEFPQMIFANGSSGHGVQHAIPIGLAVSELILENGYETIDLSSLSYERFCTEGGSKKEKNVY
ncbi:FAD-dependent oxidoreductase domain-containing protein 1 [Lingula anatina]|uniref:FAD-dependent oxidoreductase domain-containing protein 1 n=1 Tax=Lingula anatina TaxID=7574 RepID=A0A1S3IW43_LINAN|nr:FAD-dependent oxidoreductase domain-containing protein 1 [Lingula anatina]|eukprot:XP_013402283.1 FAD-dependent oxidoreductase domain-containing protein 1 [Lingula anatina]